MEPQLSHDPLQANYFTNLQLINVIYQTDVSYKINQIQMFM